MVDIQVRPYHDLTSPKVQQNLLSKIASGRYFAVLFSPPCSTFTRVVWANRKGPRPVRSYTMPRGFNRMTWAERKRANWGNTMTDFTYKGFKIQVIDVGGIAVFENPEDLGAVKHGEHRGVRPASMWQWEQFEQLLRHQQVATVAFYQQDFGTEYLKPTRLMLGNLEARHDSFCQGPPHFNDQGFYEGPLQQRESATRLVGTSSTGFATTGTEQWPSEMCRWIAVSILQQFVQQHAVHHVLAVEGGAIQKPSDKMGGSIQVEKSEYPILQPDGPKTAGGWGKPRQCQPPGKERQFHDGAGLSSMGRWDVEQRVW